MLLAAIYIIFFAVNVLMVISVSLVYKITYTHLPYLVSCYLKVSFFMALFWTVYQVFKL